MFTLDCDVENYADDTSWIATGITIDEINETLKRNCSKVNCWMKANLLKLNAEKTHVLTVGTKERLNVIPHKVEVVMDDILLKDSESGYENILGCQVSSDLKWHTHVKNLKTKLSQRLVDLSTIQYSAPFIVKKSIAEGIFTSTLAYCSPLFGGTEEQSIRDLQVLQNRAAQIVCSTPARFSRRMLFDRIKWLSVNQLIVYFTLVMVFKVRKYDQPEYLAAVLNRDTRGHRIFRSKARLSLTSKSFTFRGAALCNTLPLSLRTMNNAYAFKKEFQLWIHQNVQRFLE